MKATIRIITFTLLFLTVGVAYAHDIWLFPERFALSKGDTLIVRQLVGNELDSELELPLLRRMTPRFDLMTPNGSVDLLSELPDMRTQPVVKPVLERKLDVEGFTLLAMEQDFIHTEFPREKFVEYLQHEENLEKYQNLLGNRPAQRERYARALKCLVQVGKITEGTLYKQVLGHKIEILLLQNPYLLDPDDTLDVQVLFEGKPVSDQLVMAFNTDGKRPVSKSTARTNANGIARFTLDRGGVWLIRLVHLLPCSTRPDADCSYVDWESYWASYIFKLD